MIHELRRTEVLVVTDHNRAPAADGCWWLMRPTTPSLVPQTA